MSTESAARAQVCAHDRHLRVLLGALDLTLNDLERARLDWLREQVAEWVQENPHHLIQAALDQQAVEARTSIAASADRLRAKIDEIRAGLAHLTDEEIVI